MWSIEELKDLLTKEQALKNEYKETNIAAQVTMAEIQAEMNTISGRSAGRVKLIHDACEAGKIPMKERDQRCREIKAEVTLRIADARAKYEAAVKTRDETANKFVESEGRIEELDSLLKEFAQVDADIAKDEAAVAAITPPTASSVG